MFLLALRRQSKSPIKSIRSTCVAYYMSDPFGHRGQASLYGVYRPTYPSTLLKKLAEATKTFPHHNALDVATGSGQLAQLLASLYENVTGIDRSMEQLKHAQPCSNITYVLGDAMQLPLPNNETTWDLVAVGQALHWFDIPRFFDAVKKVIDPEKGTLAVFGYGLVSLNIGQSEFKRFYATMNNYWDIDRGLLDSGFGDITIPFDNVERAWEYDVRVTTLDNFISYVRTWSAYNTWRTRHPDKEDPLLALRDDINKERIRS